MALEFHRDPENDEEIPFTIDDIQIPGVYEAVETGAGFTEEYRAEVEEQSGGTDQATEPPAAELEVTAYIRNETWEQLNALREQRAPFPVSVGPFAFEEMGIQNLEKTVQADRTNTAEVSIQLQEYREVVVQESSTDDTDSGSGGGGGSGNIGDSPDAGWVDEDGDGRDDNTGDEIPEMNRETYGDETITVSSGDEYGRELIDISSGSAPIVDTTGSNWSVQDVGFNGTYGSSSNTGNPFNIDETGGSSLMRNIYIGDGAPMYDGTVGVATGSTGAWYRNTSSGHLEGRYINVAGFPDNGLYWSAPSSGTCALYDCFGANNGIGTYRTRNAEVEGCVGHHNGDGHADHGGRVIWVWKGGTTNATDCDFVVSGGSSHAVVVGENAAGTANLDNCGIQGNINRKSGSTANVTNERSADASNFHDRVPGSAMDAAAGEVDPGDTGDGGTV